MSAKINWVCYQNCQSDIFGIAQIIPLGLKTIKRFWFSCSSFGKKFNLIYHSTWWVLIIIEKLLGLYKMSLGWNEIIITLVNLFILWEIHLPVAKLNLCSHCDIITLDPHHRKMYVLGSANQSSFFTLAQIYSHEEKF